MVYKTTLSILILSISALYGVLAAPSEQGSARLNADSSKPCSTRHAKARLTGWKLNKKMPKGTATFDGVKNELSISVTKVALADGTELSVLIGEKRIGSLNALKDGEAAGILSRPLDEGDRVRVLNGSRPVVSGSLVCDAAPTPETMAAPAGTPSN